MSSHHLSLETRSRSADGIISGPLVSLPPSKIATYSKRIHSELLSCTDTWYTTLIGYISSAYMKRVQEGKIKLRAKNLPSFLYEEGTVYCATREDKGLFRGHVVIRVSRLSRISDRPLLKFDLGTSAYFYGGIVCFYRAPFRRKTVPSRAPWDATCYARSARLCMLPGTCQVCLLPNVYH
jgi:hypothetical protein